MNKNESYACDCCSQYCYVCPDCRRNTEKLRHREKEMIIVKCRMCWKSTCICYCTCNCQFWNHSFNSFLTKNAHGNRIENKLKLGIWTTKSLFQCYLSIRCHFYVLCFQYTCIHCTAFSTCEKLQYMEFSLFQSIQWALFAIFFLENLN